MYYVICVAPLCWLQLGYSEHPMGLGNRLQLVQDNRPYESVTESTRLFDPQNEQIIRGVITKVSAVPMEHDTPFTQLTLQTDEGSVQVHLGPRWFMQEQIHRLELDIGREVMARGNEEVIDGLPVVVAAEVTNERRGERLRLRHADGTPVWAGGERVSEETARSGESRGHRVWSQIEQRLRSDPRIYWHALEVEVRDGQATLYGKVKTEPEKALSTTIASMVPGVATVRNDVIVDDKLPERRSPDGIKAMEHAHGPTPF
jgi:hypothetical protein